MSLCAQLSLCIQELGLSLSCLLIEAQRYDSDCPVQMLICCIYIAISSLLEYEYTSNFSAIFARENCFRVILFTFPEGRPCLELYSYNIEFALWIEPSEEKRVKIESPKYVIVHLIVIRYIAMNFSLFY